MRGASRRAARWLEAGLLDLEFYAALRGRDFADEVEAAEDFVADGMCLRLTPHPFLDFASLPAETRRAWRQGRVRQVLDRLADGEGRIRHVSPVADSPDRAAARAHLLDLAARLGREDTAAPGAGTPGIGWSELAGRPRRTGLTSVVMVAGQVRQTRQAVEILLRHAEGHDVQVVVVDRGSPAHVALGLQAALHDVGEVELLRVPGAPPEPEAANHGLARVDGDVAVVLQPHIRARRGWLTGVLDALADPAVAGAQPLVLRTDDTIDAAGLAVLARGRGPVPLLAGHPKEDARRLEDESLSAISGDAMALRAADVVAAHGLDPALAWREACLDLCARLLERRPAGFRVVPTALVTSAGSGDHEPELPPHPGLPADPGLLERIGFLTGWRESDDHRGAPAPIVTGRRPGPPGQLRWSLKLPSAPGRGGDKWGDTHFGEALANALRDLGQDVVTCRRGAHETGPTHLDDVALAVRGLYPIPPVAGQVNALWVISHPDDVHPDEFDGYDLVFAASHPWSAVMSARAGREVIPLLQATDFEPPPGVPATASDEPSVVFVGKASPERERPLVRMAVEAGVPLAVYGPGWEGLPEGIWRGEYVDNRALPELYHRHGIVLADHWPDMARHGFVANRVFDALASGARVICDDVDGVHDVFDRRDVVVARTPAEISRAVAELLDAPPKDDVPRPALAFHDRARTLLERATG